VTAPVPTDPASWLDAAPGGASLGAVALPDGHALFRVWAPLHEHVSVHVQRPVDVVVPLVPLSHGYHEVIVEDVSVGAQYLFRLSSGEECPDPASRLQPMGVHGPSEIVALRQDGSAPRFVGPELAESVFYELHVGTFSEQGTFAGVIPHLDQLVDLGVTTVELMPVSQFPGSRNWGYDGVFPWSVQASYGGPAGLRVLVDECHARGLAVALDVVYNHLGPDGNYLGRFGPYFTSRYQTPWGPALNFDGPFSDEVRRYFIQSAIHFFSELKVDAFRLDAVHAILDTTARPFLEDFAETLHRRAAASGGRVLVIGESSLNDPRLIRPVSRGGLGLDGQWSDDFHHACHALLTGERQGYYCDFGALSQLAAAYRSGFVHGGQRSEFLQRAHGRALDDGAAKQLVVCTQNHDQIGNRARGDRLARSLSPAQQRLAAGLLLLGPSVPLLFMGQEWGETAPFAYFTSHENAELARAVRRGRVEEFIAFGWRAEEIPDPQDESTFRSSRLDWTRAAEPSHRALFELHRALLRLRRENPAFQSGRFVDVEIREQQKILISRLRSAEELVALFSFSGQTERVELPVLAEAGRGHLLLDSEDPRWLGQGENRLVGTGSPHAVTVELAPNSFLVLEMSRST